VHHRLALFSGGVLVAALTACTTSEPLDAPHDIRTGHVSSPIEGGYLDDGDKHVVGLIRFSQQAFGSCSGTLIAPNVVLTAQHCIAPSSGGGSVLCGDTLFGSAYPADQLYVTTRTSFTQNPSDYHGSIEVLVPPAGSAFCGNDQALVILAQPIDASEATPAVPRVDEPLVADEEYYAVGYGAQYDSNNAPSGTRHRRDALFTQCVGDTCSGNSIASTEWLGDTGVCQGDSGGPAFDLFNRVHGVASRGATGCEFPIYGHVFGWAQWIKDVTIYASNIAGLEPPPWATGYPTDPAFSHPIGQSCNGDPINCPSGACVDDYCTRLCTLAAPCPEGYECSPDGWCIQLPPPPEPVEENEPSGTESSSCAYQPSKEPTKPIPWKWALALAGLAWLSRRRDR